MRMFFYIISLSIVLFIGLSAHAKSSPTYARFGDINQLVFLNPEADDDRRAVLISTDEDPERTCACVCLPSYEGEAGDTWVCTTTSCSYQGKKCKANVDDYF